MTNLRDLVNIKKKRKLGTTIGLVYFLFEGCNDEIVPFVTELKGMGLDYVQIKPCGDFEKNNYVYKKDTYRKMINKSKEVEKLNFEIG